MTKQDIAAHPLLKASLGCSGISDDGQAGGCNKEKDGNLRAKELQPRQESDPEGTDCQGLPGSLSVGAIGRGASGSGHGGQGGGRSRPQGMSPKETIPSDAAHAINVGLLGGCCLWHFMGAWLQDQTKVVALTRLLPEYVYLFYF